MTATLIILVCVLALAFLVWRVIGNGEVHRRDISCLSPNESENDLSVLSLLLSHEENDYLRKSLPDSEFRVIKRQRVSLARKYLKAISTNTGELIRAAEAARSSGDTDVAQAANELLQMAFRVRLNVPLVHVCLLLEWLLPTVGLVTSPKLTLYRDMVEKIVFILQRLHTMQSSTSSAG